MIRNWFRRHPKLEEFLGPEEQARVVAAIGEAERQTSGELRVHIELHCPGEPLKRASQVFSRLGMHQTELRNGVLIYCALQDRRFALYGDAGIHERVGDAFWQQLAERVQQAIKGASLAAGLELAAAEIGRSLREHFPRSTDDRNELPDTLSFRS